MSTGAHPGWSDLRVGLAVLICAVPLAAGVFWLDALRRMLVEGPELVILADEISGLEPGDGVWVAGRPSGRVTAISFVGTRGADPGRVAVRLVLLREAAPALRRDAQARIGSSALLAPPVVKLSPGSPDAPPYDFSDTLAVSTLPGVDEFRALADSGRAAVADLQEELRRLDRELETGRGTLPRLRRDPTPLDDLRRQRRRYDDLLRAWENGSPRTAWRDTALHASGAAIARRLRRIAKQPAADSLATALTRLPDALDALRARADRLSGRLEAAEGTFGRLAGDDELRRQAERNRSLLDSLLVESRRQPLRFLHFRLF